jgi:hypothetical protein
MQNLSHSDRVSGSMVRSRHQARTGKTPSRWALSDPAGPEGLKAVDGSVESGRLERSRK